MEKVCRHYTLFIDESGQFGEDSLEKERREEQPSSQICGVLLPGTYEKKKRGRDLPTALLKYFPIGAEKHAVDMSHAQRALLVDKILKEIQHTPRPTPWRLVRLVNNSGIGEGSVIHTYTRMVAELIVYLYQSLLDEEPDETPVIHLTYAQLLLGKLIDGKAYYFSRNEVTPELRYKGKPIMIPILDYHREIQRELQIDLHHGLGLSEQAARNVLGKVNEESARIHPALQLSDLISNCTYKRGRALRKYPTTRNLLLDVLEPYDYELHPLKAQHQAEELASHRALGQAIYLLIHHLHEHRLSKQAKARIHETLVELIEDLAEEHSAEQYNDLSALLEAIEDIVHRQRDASFAEDMIKTFLSDVLEPLETKLKERQRSGSLDWVRFRLFNLALANANHSGNMKSSFYYRGLLEELLPLVNDRWEDIPTIMESQLNIAVSYGQNLNFAQGVELAEEVCGFYQDLSSMMSVFRGKSLLAPKIKIAKHGSALGTTLMLERYLCLERLADGQPIDDLIERGKALGASALEMLTSQEDRMRVYQQLAHLEALAGSFDQAWAKLYLGLGGVESSLSLSPIRQQCLTVLSRLDDFSLHFPLFHTLRLCLLELSVSQPSQDLLQMINDLLSSCQKRCDDLLAGQKDDYPSHAILRVWSNIQAKLGNHAKAIGSVRVLSRLVSKQPRATSLQIIALCSRIETAIYLSTHEHFKDRVRTLLSAGKSTDDISVSNLFQKLKKQLKSETKLYTWLLDLEEGVKNWEKDKFDQGQTSLLLKLTARFSN